MYVHRVTTECDTLTNESPIVNHSSTHIYHVSSSTEWHMIKRFAHHILKGLMTKAEIALLHNYRGTMSRIPNGTPSTEWSALHGVVLTKIDTRHNCAIWINEDLGILLRHSCHGYHQRDCIICNLFELYYIIMGTLYYIYAYTTVHTSKHM